MDRGEPPRVQIALSPQYGVSASTPPPHVPPPPTKGSAASIPQPPGLPSQQEEATPSIPHLWTVLAY